MLVNKNRFKESVINGHGCRTLAQQKQKRKNIKGSNPMWVNVFLIAVVEQIYPETMYIYERFFKSIFYLLVNKNGFKKSVINGHCCKTFAQQKKTHKTVVISFFPQFYPKIQ